MPRYSIDGAILEDIADAINAKTGETAAMAPGEMADAISSISGGGNPNYIETIEGTLGNPWGDYSLRNDLAPKILSNDIDFYITFSLNGASYVAFPNRGTISAATHVCSAYSVTATAASLSLLRYSPTGTLQSAKVIPELTENDSSWNGSGISLDPTTPCTLTIIHHPLPDSE